MCDDACGTLGAILRKTQDGLRRNDGGYSNSSVPKTNQTSRTHYRSVVLPAGVRGGLVEIDLIAVRPKVVDCVFSTQDAFCVNPSRHPADSRHDA